MLENSAALSITASFSLNSSSVPEHFHGLISSKHERSLPVFEHKLHSENSPGNGHRSVYCGPHALVW